MNVTNSMHYPTSNGFSSYLAGIDLLISNNMVFYTVVKGNGQLKNPYFEKESSLNAFCGMSELQKLQQIAADCFQGYSYSHFCIIIRNFNNQKIIIIQEYMV